jgi:hypothetical protein
MSGGLQSRSEWLKKRKFLTLPGLQLRPLSRPARSQPLYRLHYPGSYFSLRKLYIFEYLSPTVFELDWKPVPIDHKKAWLLQPYTIFFLCNKAFTHPEGFPKWNTQPNLDPASLIVYCAALHLYFLSNCLSIGCIFSHRDTDLRRANPFHQPYILTGHTNKLPGDIWTVISEKRDISLTFTDHRF